MQGLELSRAFYNEFGKPMLDSEFSHLKPYICTGLFGAGSECLGFDDDISSDHDFEPGFCIFLPGEDIVSRRDEFLLERAYSKLPKEFLGYKRGGISPVGGVRHGVFRTEEFFKNKSGSSDGILTIEEWFKMTDQSLLECTNGEIYSDLYGEVSKIRENLSYYPSDIMKKKLSSNLLVMAQAGQYNYMRTISHGEYDAAQLACFEFVKAALQVIFILNRKYMPYYKWAFKALNNLDILFYVSPQLSHLINTDNSKENIDEKYALIESISSDVISELIDQNLTKANCGDLEKHAYSVNDGIEDADIRNMHIMSGI